MARVLALCDGSLTFTASGPQCAGTWIEFDVGQIPGFFDVALLDAGTLVQSWTAGFVFGGAPMAAAYAIGAIVDFVKRL
ncbi:MAG: hypothetical protein AAF417_21905 [Pseudomonadota bacterium]